MFKVFVTVHILLSGAPVGDPIRMTNQVEYATVEECVIGKDTEVVQAAIDNIRLALERNKPENASYTLTVGCEKFDNGSI